MVRSLIGEQAVPGSIGRVVRGGGFRPGSLPGGVEPRGSKIHNSERVGRYYVLECRTGKLVKLVAIAAGVRSLGEVRTFVISHNYLKRYYVGPSAPDDVVGVGKWASRLILSETAAVGEGRRVHVYLELDLKGNP